MKSPLCAMTIQTKLMLLGLACVLVTALSLVSVGLWQGRVFSHKAAMEARKLVDADLDHITESVYNLIKYQDESSQEKINHDLHMVHYVLDDFGQVYLSAQVVPWKAVNQYTAEVFEITLPKIMVGGQWLGQTKPMPTDARVIDHVKRLVGNTCTIFQRINPEGDMLRVSTTNETQKSAQAVGTFIPAINPDGTLNPIITTVMSGKTYRKTSYAANRLHIAVYEPLYDAEEKIIGILHVSVNNNYIAALRKAIFKLTIGQSGYVFVLGGKGKNRGRYIVSKNGQRDGESLWGIKDVEGRYFVRSIVHKAIACRPGQFETVRYPWKNPGEAFPRQKIAHITYYEPWDWIIGASAYEDEINQSAEIISQGYKSMARFFGMVAVGVALFGVIGTWFFARRISDTLRVVTQAATKMTRHDLPRLVRTMDAVNAGDLSVKFQLDYDPVDIKSGDELGAMAKAFNRMNKALVNVGIAFTTMVANLRDLTRLLEHKVTERTSELEASERKLLSIIDFLPDATLVIDHQGKVIAWNRAMEKMTGVKSGKMIGKGDYAYSIPFIGHRHPIMIDLVLNPDASLEKQYRSFRREGNTLFAEACTYRLKETPVHLFIAATTLRNADGEVIGAIETLRDITSWKETEKELIQARRMAEVASQTKSEFLANMSHEIRTPMNGVLGMTGLLLDTPLNDEQREYAQTAQSSADALLTIINDILDFSKIEAGKLDFEELDFDLRLALDEIAELASIKANEKKVEFVNYVHPDVPSMLVGDPGRLRQVLLNLATNAIKFTDQGEVVVEVSLASESAYHAVIHFKVRDTGIGIPENRLGRLFKSFSQVDSSTTRKFGGTGLGLAISKRLVDMMGWEIGVESRDGKGSTFWFTAELKKQEDAGKGRDPYFMPENIKGKRILAVDDNAVNRRVMQAYLHSWQCRTTVVDSSEKAMALMESAVDKSEPFDMAIIDFMMPGMDGQALGKAIKAHPELKDTPMILLTSRGMRGDAAKARSAGFDAYLTKPIKQSQLFDAVLSVFGKPLDTEYKEKPSIITRHTIAETGKKKLKILLCEDNPVNQKVAMIHLKKFGYVADLANNGQEALAAVKTRPYDLVLMDVQMPEMDGLEATKAIRSAGLRVPIVAMTANAMKGDREKCLDSGMDDYISKPINPKILLEKIKQWASAPAPPHNRQNQSRLAN
ncbi:MAG: Cache 3/Cache 2 fusion domain-containing protein [Desulfobacteraceae bacterium]